MDKLNWTDYAIKKLYYYKFVLNLDNRSIAMKLNKSYDAVRHKLKRFNWSVFHHKDKIFVAKKWTDAEVGLLYAYSKEGYSFSEIADKMCRSKDSVQKKYKSMNWDNWSKENIPVVFTNDDEQILDTDSIDFCVDSLLSLSRNDPDRLKLIDENEFVKKSIFNSNLMSFDFLSVKKIAHKRLEDEGFVHPDCLSFGQGTYIVLGDSHGSFTSKSTVALISKVNSYLKCDKIIHIGHTLDDDNFLCDGLKVLDNLVVVARKEELKIVHAQKDSFHKNTKIVLKSVNLGRDLKIKNQDVIGDYTKSPISNLDAKIFNGQFIVNCHRMELFTRCSDANSSCYLASPGSICEKHVAKSITFDANKKHKSGTKKIFSAKHNRMNYLVEYWDQGFFVVHVDGDLNHTIVPCVIKKVKNVMVTSYFDKIITSDKVTVPDTKIFISADSHCPNHSSKILDIQDQIVKDYCPDVFVNLGDSADYKSLNHHILNRGGVVNSDLIYEAASVFKVLKQQSLWAPKKYIQHGNHERFANDFIEKFPQLKNILNFNFLCSPELIGYDVIPLKTPLKLGQVTFVHGDMKLYGQNGSLPEKISRTFGEYTFMGHTHSPCIRFGTYIVGLTGKLDQQYNEINASNWINGFGMCNQYQGISWPTNIMIIGNKCSINNKNYYPQRYDIWDLDPDSYSFKLIFDYK